MAETGEVQLHFLDYWRVVKNRWGIITLTFLLVVVTAYITTYFLPRGYTSRVTIEVKSNENHLKIFNGNDGFGTVDTHFVADQFQILQSKAILYPVIDELGLIDKWAVGMPAGSLTKEEAYDKLLGMMRNLREVRNTDMLIIEVSSTDKQEAADIANTIAVIYQKKRRDDQLELIDGGLRELKDQVDKQQSKVDAASASLTAIRIHDKINDPNPDTIESTGDMEPERNLLPRRPNSMKPSSGWKS